MLYGIALAGVPRHYGPCRTRQMVHLMMCGRFTGTQPFLLRSFCTLAVVDLQIVGLGGQRPT
jgi:hypothetical protein